MEKNWYKVKLIDTKNDKTIATSINYGTQDSVKKVFAGISVVPFAYRHFRIDSEELDSTVLFIGDGPHPSTVECGLAEANLEDLLCELKNRGHKVTLS